MSSRGLFSSMALIAGAQSINVVVSILRVKALAILLGPSGIGLLSIYQSFKDTAVTGASLGINLSGVREIAANKDDDMRMNRVRRVLVFGLTVQGLLAMVVIWAFRHTLSQWLFADPSRSNEVAIIGFAVLLTLVASSHSAVLQGFRRIGDFARSIMFGALLGTIVGLIAVLIYGSAGLLALVLALPFGQFVAALYYTRRLPRVPFRQSNAPMEFWSTWKPMFKLGMAFMVGGLVTTATLLFVRSYIVQRLGIETGGQFAAAWTISTTYIGFLLSAMAADYFPRLSATIDDKPAISRLINDQIQLGLAVGGPILLVLIGLAPWVMTMLYSNAFGPAAELVQWQTVGNFFKLSSWAIGFLFVAAGRGKLFLFLQIHFNLWFVALLVPGLLTKGLVATGPAFTVAYAVHFLVLAILAKRLYDFRWQRLSIGLQVAFTVLAMGLLALALYAPVIAAFVSIGLGIATGLVSLRIILTKIGIDGRITTALAGAFNVIGWPIKKSEASQDDKTE